MFKGGWSEFCPKHVGIILMFVGTLPTQGRVKLFYMFSRELLENLHVPMIPGGGKHPKEY